MNYFNANREAVEHERDLLVEQLKKLEADPGATFYEARVIQGQIEQMEHRLIWFDMAPDGWFI